MVKEAASRGLVADSIVFSDRIDKDEHLFRILVFVLVFVLLVPVKTVNWQPVDMQEKHLLGVFVCVLVFVLLFLYE